VRDKLNQILKRYGFRKKDGDIKDENIFDLNIKLVKSEKWREIVKNGDDNKILSFALKFLTFSVDSQKKDKEINIDVYLKNE